jgi:hypothetical protein
VSNLSRRPGSGVPRSARERRAYNLVLGGGIAGAVGVVTLLLAVLGVMGFAIPVLALVIAALCAWLFRRTMSA